jgi:hypothetical protein
MSTSLKNIIVILKYQSPADVYQYMYRSLSKYIVIPNGGHEIVSTINVGFQSLRAGSNPARSDQIFAQQNSIFSLFKCNIFLFFFKFPIE